MISFLGKSYYRKFLTISRDFFLTLSTLRLMQQCTDILVNVNSTCITHCPIFLISHQIHGTPNTRFFMFFCSKLGGEKRVIVVEQSVPIKLCVIGVSGKSKSCLGLGYTEACGTIRCHLKIF